jgi:superfamily II DNA or RNA helicase
MGINPVKLFVVNDNRVGGSDDVPTPDSIEFLKFVNEKLSKYRSTEDQLKSTTCEDLVNSQVTNTEFFRQQKLIGDYMNDIGGYRGILIYWGLGTGKTGGAINITETMKDRDVIWLIPTKSLYNEVYDQLSIFGDKNYRHSEGYANLPQDLKNKEDDEIRAKIDVRYKIMTYNSSALITKLYRIYASTDAIDADDLMHVAKNVQMQKNPLDNKLLIIDEVHNMLRQMIAEGSKIGSNLFHMIMEAKNLKIVCMSGTPIADDPYNLAALFNMLRGYIRIGKETYTLFPSDYQQFNNYFVDSDKNEIKNKKVFAERINGLVSYYSGIYDESSELFPMAREHIVNCIMSPYQQSGYNEVRKKEIRAERNSKKMKGQMIKSNWKKPGRKSAMSSYRMNSRQRCNFVFPDYIERPKNVHLMSGEQKRNAILGALNGLLPEDISPTGNLRIYSEKMYQIVTRILAAKGPVVVYSQFVELEGLGVLAKILWNLGFRNWNSPKDAPKFAYFTGKTKNKHKEILQMYNNPKNSDASMLKVLLINVVGIEGLNLKGTREIHYMEEYWFEDRFKQVKGRGVRTCSHWHLPKEDRFVDIYRYHSVPNNKNDFLLLTGEHETTDQYLYNLAKTRAKLSNSFLEVLKSSAFDCELNYEHNKSSMAEKCMKCYSDPELAKTRKMYPADIKMHMSPGNSFGCIATKSRQLRKHIDNGITYFIDEETKKVYQKNKDGIAVEVGQINTKGDIIWA